MIDQIEITIEDNLKEFYNKFKKYLNNLIDKNTANYKLKSPKENETIDKEFAINGEKIFKSIDVINVIFPVEKEAQAQFIPLKNDNRFKLRITGESKNLFKNRIEFFIQLRGLKPKKENKETIYIKESKLKEIIRKYVKEAIQRI